MIIRRSLSIVTLLALGTGTLCLPARAQHTAQDLQALQSNTNPTNVHLVRSLAKDIQHDLGPDPYHAKLAATPSNQQEFVQTLKDIATSYEQRKRQNDIGLAVLKANNTLVKKAIGAGLALAPETGGGSLLVSSIGFVASAGLDKVEALAKDAARDEVRRNLKAQLEAYRTKTSEGAYLQLAAQKDPAAFRAELERELGPIFGDELKNIKPEDQDIVNAFYNKELATVVQNGLGTLAQVQSIQGQAIQANRKDIIALARTFSQYAEHNENQLKEILQTQKDIQAGLDKLNQRIGKTEQGIDFIQNYMFGKMSPDEQLNALESGIFPGMPQEQRDDLEEKIKLVKQREDFTKQLASYLNGANEVANIARNLGVDPKIVNTIQDTVNIGTSAFQAFEAFSSGNLLSGVSALSNILGLGGGRDIAGERHEEEMRALHILYNKVDVIDQKINVLIQGQEQILKNQQVTYDAIVQLGEHVEKNQQELLARLQAIQGDILYNRQLILQTVLTNYAKCDKLRANPVTGKTVIDTARNLYPSYDEFLDLYRDFRDDLDACLPQLETTRLPSHEFAAFFALETYKTLDKDVTTYDLKVYEPALALVRDSVSGPPSDLSKKFSSLLSPMGEVPSLDDKLAMINDAWEARFQVPFDVLMNQLLSPAAVGMHATYLLDCHFYFLLINPATEQPYAFVDLVKAKDVRRTGYYALVEALDLIDIAIAQQTLISGDVLLPFMYQVTQRGQASGAPPQDQELYRRVREMLKGNSVMAHDYLVYSLRKDVKAQSNFLNYGIALGSHDPYLLKKCTVLDWHFNWRPDKLWEGKVLKQPAGWSVELEGQYYAMPTAEELADGKLEYQPDLYPLLKLRTRLTEEIASYELLKGLEAKQRGRFNTVLLNGIRSETDPETKLSR